MDNNDSMKSQQTGGLKLMTVFIAVLALHVVVIGGFTVYHLMSGGSTDADLVTTDKTHKGTAMADGTVSDTTSGDKGTTSTTASTETASTPATTPDADQTAPTTGSPATTAATTVAPAAVIPAATTAVTPAAATTIASTTTPAPAVTPAPVATPAPALVSTPTLTLNAPKPLQLAPPTAIAEQSQATGPIQPSLAPPLDNPPAFAPAPAPMTALAAGPVHMPPGASEEAVAPKAEREHEHMQVYVVKITDSYKKIAKAHHVTVAQLKEANHIKGDTLHTGQKLFIPSEKKFVAENSQASNLSSAPSGPILSNSVAPMTAGLTSTATEPGLHHHLYTIEKGDTLVKIAHKFKTTPSAIMAENSIADPTKLTIGKKLKIPSKEARSAKIAEPATVTPEATAAPAPIPAEAKEQYETPTSSGQLANFTP